MECTQRLECTQDLYETHTEKICPEQIGFLGICGAKHPVVKGPNKIGRDPHTCNIIINKNSVSRQHAVINVLNSNQYMLMDLDSANKTKLSNKTLEPYIPHPLNNGDTVQFGEVFGIFRLLEEDNELPMTQVIDIPDTPIPSRHVSKLAKVPTTVIPESPDVSDRDDSFCTPSQVKTETTRLSSCQFIKPFGKSIPIQPISTPKSDTSRDASKRSISFVDNPNTSLNESHKSINDTKNDIHEMDTQAPYPITNPPIHDSTDSIYMADTQAPPGLGASPSIHSLDTQIPTEHLPQVHKINDQQDMQFDIYAANKENDISIFNAETQPFVLEKDKSMDKSKISNASPKSVNKSEEELLFDEIEEECLEDFNSQPLLPQESPKHEFSTTNETAKPKTIVESDNSTDCEDIDMIPTQIVEELPAKDKQTIIKEKVKPTVSKRTNRIQSEDSTDCEDLEFMPTQKIEELPVKVKSKEIKEKSIKNAGKRVNRIKSDSSTDCEDIDIRPMQKIPETGNKDEDLTDCEDDFIEITKTAKPVEGINLEDMPTQVIGTVDKPAFEDMPTQIIDDNVGNKSNNDNIEDQPTQIIDEIIPNDTEAAKKSFKEIISPFKIPIQSPIRVKSKDIPKAVPKPKVPETITIEDDYYNSTQDIIDDLCTQRNGSPILGVLNKSKGNDSPVIIDDDIVPCSVENYRTGDKFANIDKELSPTKPLKDQKGLGGSVDKFKKFPSDSSDLERTPKKYRSIMFTDSDLPSSQEIKTSIVNHTKSYATDSSSESEIEQNTENSQEGTPFLHRKKKKSANAKMDLSKKFDVEKLPERIITRVRKPTAKVADNLQLVKKVSANILKPKFLTEQEDQVNEDIITENVQRLKTYEKAKSNKDGKTDIKSKNDKNNKTHDCINESVDEKSKNKETVNQTTIETKIDDKIKSKDAKEKFKVKIEKPKKKEESNKKRKSKEESTRKSKEKTITERKSADKSTEEKLQSKSEERMSTRSTRSKRKENESKPTSPEDKLPETKRKRSSRKKEPAKESISPEKEVRRSRRQAKVKENKSDSQISQPKSILKKSVHEQSTVYNISSSSVESPKAIKRSLVDDSDVPSPKRTRAFVNNSINNAFLRATPARTMKTQYVLFTAFPSEEVKHKLEKLGAVIVTDVTQCSVVLTMQVKRTFKLLCAVGLGKPIVGPSWVQACVDTHTIVDPWLYLIKDEQAEKRFQFCLERTLNGKRNFLKGYNVSSTASVQPNASEMKLIVECSGGTWKEGGSNWVCVSSTKDQALWPALRKRGATVVSTEFILGGVLRQKLEITTNKFP